MYLYIKDRKAFLIMPVVGGTEIATDKESQTFKSLQKFTENVMEELNFMEDLLIVLGQDYSDILNEIVHLKELYTSARNTGIFENISTFGYDGVSPILCTVNSMLLDVSIEKDDFTNLTDHTFSARNGVLGSALRDQISRIKSVKDNIPSIKLFKDNLPTININDTETAVLQKCEDTWNKCNFSSDKWQDISGALKKRIALIKEYCAEDGTEFDKEQLTGGLEDIALEDIANEINFNNFAKYIFSTIANQSRRDDKTSILTQFFLATVNIYIKDLNGSCNNFGKIFDANKDLSMELAIVVKNSLEAGFNTEEKIINFLVEKQIINALSPEQITEIKKIFTRQYCMIRKSTQFDEFIVLPKNTNSPWFEYDGSFCVEFSYLCSNIPGLEDIQKDLHRDKYIELKRDSQNSLQFMNPTSNFDLDNTKINLDNNNINNLLSLSESNYNQAHLFIKKIAGNIDFSNDHDEQVIQKLFFYALEYKNKTLLLKTLENGANPNIPNKSGQTPLHFAIKYGRIKTVQDLLYANADPNIADKYGQTALNYAVQKGNLEIVQALLNANADPNIKNQNSDTALHSAAKNGHIEIVQALLQSGANINTTNKYGDTALHWAMRENNELVEAIFNYGANPNNINDDGNGWTSINIAANDGWKLTNLVANDNKLEIIKLLIEAKANPNITNNSGQTPLHLATNTWVIEHTDGHNPLFRAVVKGNVEIVQALLKAGTDANIADKYGQTALNYAITTRNNELVKALIDAKSKLNAQDVNGKTPLHHVCKSGNMEIIETIIKAIKGSTEITKQTTEKFSTLGIFSKDKEREDNDDKINSIINIKDNQGLTAIDYAINPEVKELLTKEFFNSHSNNPRNSK